MHFFSNVHVVNLVNMPSQKEMTYPKSVSRGYGFEEKDEYGSDEEETVEEVNVRDVRAIFQEMAVMTEQQDALQQDIDLITPDLQNKQAELETVAQDLDSKETKLEKLSADVSQKQLELNEKTTELRELTELCNKSTEDHVVAQEKAEELNQQIKNCNNELKIKKSEIKTVERQCVKNAQKLQKIENQVVAEESKLKNLRVEIVHAEKKLKDCEDRMAELERQIEQQYAAITVNEKTIDEQQKEIEANEQKIAAQQALMAEHLNNEVEMRDINKNTNYDEDDPRKNNNGFALEGEEDNPDENKENHKSEIKKNHKGEIKKNPRAGKLFQCKLPWWKKIIFAILSVLLFPFRFVYLRKFFPVFLEKPKKPYEIHKGKDVNSKKAIVVFRGSDGSLPEGLMEKLKEQKPDCDIIVVNYDKKYLGYTVTDKKTEKFAEHVYRDLHEKGYEIDTVYGYSLGAYFASLMISAAEKVHGTAKEKLKEMKFVFDRGFTSFTDCALANAIGSNSFLMEIGAFHFKNFGMKFENFLMSQDPKKQELIRAIDPKNIKLIYGEQDGSITEETNMQKLTIANEHLREVVIEKVAFHGSPMPESFHFPEHKRDPSNNVSRLTSSIDRERSWSR